ncbi:MAG TPA: outer membrane protein assembly factor BamD [Candidatus Angelobacter sp.]|nr:outer membrane protein assembly factor BamD [Candidatus Angelobacter sp.]
MLRKLVISFLLAAPLLVAGCHHAKVQNPIANVDSKQPDKVLFDRAMKSMKSGKYTEARTLLETLIQTYPDSEYVARAKLSLGDAWYAEGGTAGLQQAEVQYKDFITFFPNMPEAAEAQFKVANIHYKEMEKPDRDFTQAMRAADEYKTMIQQFPDSKLVPQARQRLREVQEVLGDRQWRIAHFYYLRNNLAAAQARLTSLVDSYPLYSAADEALFLLGNIYEKEAAGMRAQKKVAEVFKAKLAAEYDQKAIESYSRLITRYPAMARADDARARLAAMKAPVPTPTPEAIAANQAEEDSRGDVTKLHQMVGNFKKHPNVSKSATVGEPNLEEEEIASAPALVQHLNDEIRVAAGQGTQQVSAENVKVGTGPAPGANQPPPSGTTSQPGSPNTNQPAPSGQSGQPSATAGNSAPPKQINEIGSGSDSGSQSTTQTTQDGQQNTSDQQDSSSKKKKKKGLRKLIPF